MNIRNLALAGFALTLAITATRAQAATEALDAVSAASVVVSTPTVTTTTAKLSFTETETNGSLRFYYSTASFTAADTTKATVSKVSVTNRGGSLSLTGLTAGTTYYYRFQGYYPGKNVTNYTASGSFTTTAITGIHGRPLTTGNATAATTNVLGRPVGRSSSISVSPTGSVPDLRGASH